MGLDTVELIMDVEDHFNISIPDAEGEKIQTAGQLLDYILSRRPELVQPRALERCATQHAFYEVRHRLCAMLPLERKSLRPKTRLADVIPVERRRDMWPQLRNRLGFTPADLQMPRGLAVAIATAGIASAVLATIYIQPYALLFAWVPVVLILSCLARPWAVCLANGGPTLGDVARGWLTHHLNEFSRNSQSDQDLLWQELVTIISEQAGIARGEISKSTHFINDLNFG